MTIPKSTIHEVDFCAQMADAINQIVRQGPANYPFRDARVEGFGSGDARRKRKDLRLFDPSGKLALCGEVKLPGTPEGQSAIHNTVVADAAAKADDAGVQYFFTWNVNEFALWDRSLWERPWFERRVRIWRLPRTLAGPQDVAREDNLQFIKTHFLPDLLRDLADILSGRRRDWSMPPDDVFIRSLESHLDWPVQLAAAYILRRAEEERGGEFDRLVQNWMREQDWTSDGYFGFLTNSSWMDVEYGFALQGWILRHFRLLAVMESAAEPWFTDARVKTCAAILQRCDDEAERMANRVRFVRFAAKLVDVIGIPAGKDEEARQAAVEALRDRILNADADYQDQHLRIIVKSQGDFCLPQVEAGPSASAVHLRRP